MSLWHSWQTGTTTVFEMKRLAASLSVVCAPWQRTQATRTVSCSRIAWYDVPARPSVSASVANVGASPPAVPGRRTIGVWHGRHSASRSGSFMRSEEHTSELQSRLHLVCRLLLAKKNLSAPNQAPSL